MEASSVTFVDGHVEIGPLHVAHAVSWCSDVDAKADNVYSVPANRLVNVVPSDSLDMNVVDSLLPSAAKLFTMT